MFRKNNCLVSAINIPRVLIIILVLSLGFSWICVSTSHKIGRLSSVPGYDDVVYFASAADLIHSLRENGWSGAVDLVLRDGLHSPYSTLLAAAAFSVEGLRPAAPYRANAVLIAVYLAAIAYFFRRSQLLFLVLALLFFLVPPFATMAVVEFRPDLAWATVVGFFAVFILTREDVFHRKQLTLFYGSCVGLGLIIKPSTFAMTLAVGAMSLGFAWVLEMTRTDFRTSVRRLGVALLWMGAAVVLVAGPYYAVFGGNVWRYFIDNTYGINAAVWAHPGDRLAQWLFYIEGEGGRCNLGNQRLIIGAAWLLLAFRRLWNGPLAVRLQTLFLGLVILIVFVVNAVAPVKSPFMGGAIYGTLLFSLAFFAGEFLAAFPQVSARNWLYASIGFAAVVLVSVCSYQWPAYSKWPRHKRNKTFVTAQQAMTVFARGRTAPKSILFTQAGPLTMENVRLFYFRRGERPECHSGAFFRTMEEFRQAVIGCELVIAQDKGTLGGTESMPAEPLQDQFVAFLEASNDFSLSKKVPIDNEDGQSRNIYFFVRNGVGNTATNR